ncbi:hypothetical protein HK096_007477, partial [Nowakowskiella sp. JEL0078]
MTARKLIQDLEEGTSCIHFENSGIELSLLSDVVKSEIVDLGTKFSIASRLTSFVAIDNNGNSISTPRQSTSQCEIEESDMSIMLAPHVEFANPCDQQLESPTASMAISSKKSSGGLFGQENISMFQNRGHVEDTSAERSHTSLFGATPMNYFPSRRFSKRATETYGNFGASPTREKYGPLDQKITPDFSSAHSFSASGNYFDAAPPPISFSHEFEASLIETNNSFLCYAPTITTKTDILLDQ